MQGKIAAIFIGPEEGGPIRRVDSVRAVAGRGLEGDRYFRPDPGGDNPSPEEEITLFPKEGVESARADSGLEIAYEDARRNVMTEGVDLTAAIGSRLSLGEVVVEVLEDNPPCAHLQKLAGKPILKPMMGRAGVRGRIVESGMISVGDAVRSGTTAPA